MSGSFPGSGGEPPPSSPGSLGSPPRTLAISLAVSLVVVSTAILVVTVFVLCHRWRRVPAAAPSVIDAAIRSIPGAETTTTLPAFSYREHGGSTHECAVCLGEVKEGEMVRQLPTCMHLYHVGCIDRWLAAQQTCPVCRSAAA